MSDLAPGLQRALSGLHEYDAITDHLSALILSYPPPFIFVHDSENVRLTNSAIRSTLVRLVAEPHHDLQLKGACIDVVACFTPRVLFDTALNSLADWTPDWRNGAANWTSSAAAEGTRFNENFDAFVHGVQSIFADASPTGPGLNGIGKGKGKAREGNSPRRRMVLVVERAERLKDSLPELIVPLTRLAELSQVDITTVFISEVQWQDIRPSLRASPEPYYIDVPFMSKEVTQSLLSSSFPPDIPEGSKSKNVDFDAYHPTLKPLYAHFVATVCSICWPFTHDPLELAYIAAARWPGFVKPILDAHRKTLQQEDAADLTPPTEDARLRLLRLFTPSLTAALEALYPRLLHATQWANIHAPPEDLLNIPPGRAPEALIAQAATNASTLKVDDTITEAGIEALPRMAKFILVAAFLASTNPARSDLRMFGRGPDERKRRRRKVGTPRKPRNGTTGTAVKIPQRLLGPTTFPLDRLIALLGVLLEENDAETRPVAPQYTLPGEYTEMEIARVALYANIVELASMRLLVRTSPPERLDGVQTFKCGIGFELAVKLARGLGIILNDLMYEVV